MMDDPYRAARLRMVDEQIVRRGVRDERVLAAMRTVPREEFVPSDERSQAYDDTPISIGEGQTISQPFTVAFMAEQAEIRPADRVLEIGAGSGYGAAILGRLAREVHTVERIPELALEAYERLVRLNYREVHVHAGDGTRGWPDGAPYDAIVVTAGGASLPSAFLDQLAIGGRLIIPIGPVSDEQVMYRFRRTAGGIVTEDLGAFRFVPLIGS